MIVIAAGSSLPFCGIDSQQIVFSAFSALGRIVHLNAVSPLYESPAWPDPHDPRFINGVALIETNLPPKALMAALHAVEAGFGRRREKRNAPRTLDLDLIAYHDLVSVEEDNGLVLPHPRAENRDFVLAPLCDIAPGWISPVSGQSARNLLEALPERSAKQISP